MIEFVRERLAPGLESKLKRWLRAPEADIFRQILVSKCQFGQAEALSHHMTAMLDGDSSDSPQSMMSSKVLQQASMDARALKVFNELAALAGTEEHFHVAKLKPPPRHARNTETNSDTPEATD